jgi:hypothetical protein
VAFAAELDRRFIFAVGRAHGLAVRHDQRVLPVMGVSVKAGSVLFYQEERADRNLALAVDGEAVFRRHSTWRHLAGIFILAVIGRFLVGIVQHVALAMGSRDIGLLRVVLPVQEELCVFVARLGIGGFNFAFEAVIDRVGFCRVQLDRGCRRTAGSARVCTARIGSDLDGRCCA